MPVAIGWAAVTGRVDPAAWILFLVIFLWTPPHYWPLSMRYKEDYANAGVPMLPVVRNSSTVAIQIILYSWAMVTSALLLIPVAQMGWTYTVVSVVAGGWFVFEAYKLYRQGMKGEVKNPMRLFHMANTYLTLLFVVIAIDPLLPF
jgi:protoheme IX farnesyltransferase